VTDSHPPKEFRLKRSSSILTLMRSFSATEKVVFGLLVLVMIVTTITMFSRANSYFLIEVPTHGGSFREGLVGLPRTINPVLAISDIDRDITSLVYAGLMKYKDGELVPDLAQSYNISDDGLTYSFTLRTDITFQDGTPVTVDDVIFTINKIQDATLKSPRRPDWTDVAIKRISPTEISFQLKQPYTPFITNTTVGILPKHIWGDLNESEFIFNGHNVEPVGAGSYKIVDISRDSTSVPTSYTLSTWNNYHGSIPFISSLVLYFFADEANALEALKTGSIDALSSISATSAVALPSDSPDTNYRVTSAPLPRIFGVFFNQNNNPVLADKTVRHALDLAIDRQTIVDTVLFGYGTPITGPFPVNKTMRRPLTTSTSSNITMAMDILESKDWKKNQEGIYQVKTKTSTQRLAFTLYTANTPDLKETATLLKETWLRLGVDVDVKIFEANDLYQNIIRTRKYDALLFGEQVGTDRDLYAFWHSSQRTAPGLNVSMYTNSKADALLEDIRTTRNETVRSKKYKEFEELIATDIPALFLYSPDIIYALPKKIRDATIANVNTPADRWSSIPSWYIMTESVWRWFTNI
jgi:peptide/nickel transport system substrate-binding protein